MTRDELRQIIKDGDEQLKASKIAWRLMSSEQRRLVLAGEQFWSQDNPITNAALDAMIAIYDTIPPQHRGDLHANASDLERLIDSHSDHFGGREETDSR